jgi:Domain of unknown function (DUF1707)
VTGSSALRASDSDREQAAEHLRHATAEGRLTADELEERLDVLYRSRTYGELDGLVADLPARGSPATVGPRPWWLGIAGAGAALLALLTILGGAVTHSTGAVTHSTGAVPRPRTNGPIGPAGPGPDAHHLMVAAASRVAVVGILIACAVLVWAFKGLRKSSSS